MDPQQQSGSAGIHWSAPTHIHTQRSNDWYWALGIVAILGIAACVWWGNLLFAAIIAVATISILIVASREPREHDVHIVGNGVVIDHELYPYNSLQSFWITDFAENPKLFLTTTGLIHPHIAVPLVPPIEAEDIRAYLEQFVPEEEGHSLGTFLAEFLGF